MESRYISLKEPAKYMSLAPKTLYDWVREKKIPAHKLGRVWRFDILELDAFIKNR